MLAEKKSKTNIGVGIGFVVQLLGNALRAQGGALVTIGLVMFIWGCMSYREGKGYSRWLGLLGLIVLVLLPDRHKGLSRGTRLG